MKDTKKREDEILKNVINILRNHINPPRIILFGSRAEKELRKKADFDIAVDEEMLNIRKLRILKDEIEKVTGLYKVDIVFLKSVDEDFRDIILKTGKVIYERGN